MVDIIVDARQARGLQIAKSARIKKLSDQHWIVPSQSHSGTYVVDPAGLVCTCPDYETRRLKCKHLWALEYVRHQVKEADGSTVVRETLRVTYRQDWSAYNAAQTHEKEHVQLLLKSLLEGIVQPPAEKKRGRPPLRLSDVIYSGVMKTFEGFSGRRVDSDIRAYQERGHIVHKPSYNSIFNYWDKPEMMPILTLLVEESAAPLASIETDFAADSTGFSTQTYYRWFDHKWGKEHKEQKWIKAHIVTGVLTNIVTAVRVTDGTTADGPELPPLLHSTAKRFVLGEVSADKAYLSHKNLAAIESVGARPLIPFKANSKGGGSAAWQRLWHLFNFQQEEFARAYHKRSNVESAVAMIKKKFGPSVRAKHPTSQMNEVLAKTLCHNLSVLVHSFYELGIEPKFWMPSTAVVREGLH